MSDSEEPSATIGEATLEPSTTSPAPSVEDPGRTIANCTCRRLELTGLLSLKQRTKLEITWHDAAEQPGDHNSKKIKKAKTRCIVKTIGYLIDVDDEYIVTSPTDLKNANNPGVDFGPINEIPIGMIQKFKILT